MKTYVTDVKNGDSHLVGRATC